MDARLGLRDLQKRSDDLRVLRKGRVSERSEDFVLFDCVASEHRHTLSWLIRQIILPLNRIKGAGAWSYGFVSFFSFLATVSLAAFGLTKMKWPRMHSKETREDKTRRVKPSGSTKQNKNRMASTMIRRADDGGALC